MKLLTPAFLTVAMLGVVGLLVAGYVAKNLLATPEKKAEIARQNIPMPVADIPAGTLITELHLGQAPVDLKTLSPDTLRSNRVIVGRYAKADLKAATAIRANQLLPPNEMPLLKVGANMRAVSIEVGESTSMVDGLIRPGNYVDVLFTFSGSEERFAGGLTMRLFEGVKIIAINRNQLQGRVDRSNNRVTLELTEAQANVVTLARAHGSINLTYNPTGRGTGGLSLSNSERVTLHEILGLKSPNPPEDPFATEIWRGGSREVRTFNDKGRFLGSSGATSGGYGGGTAIWGSYFGGGPVNSGYYNYGGYGGGYGYGLPVLPGAPGAIAVPVAPATPAAPMVAPPGANGGDARPINRTPTAARSIIEAL